MTTPTTTVFGITYDEAAALWTAHLHCDPEDDLYLALPETVRHARIAYSNGHWPTTDILTMDDHRAHWDSYDDPYAD